ncbi:MAG: DUF4157 domain-containing protein [Pseudomonadota bacterium]
MAPIFASERAARHAAQGRAAGAATRKTVLLDTLQTAADSSAVVGRIGGFSGAPIQRMGDEEALQAKGKMDRDGLPDQLRQGVEARSGMDLADMRVHHNSTAPAQVGAHAYAQGNDIHLAQGQEQHLPHEAWHVMQQRQGRVTPTEAIDGVPVNADPALEREADAMGDRLV